MTSKEGEPLERRSTRNHLSETKVPVTADRIRTLLADGVDWDDLALRFGRSKAGLKDILSGRKQRARERQKAMVSK